MDGGSDLHEYGVGLNRDVLTVVKVLEEPLALGMVRLSPKQRGDYGRAVQGEEHRLLLAL